MHACPYNSDTQLTARMNAKAKHSLPMPEKLRHRFYRKRVSRIEVNRKRVLYGAHYSYGVEL